MANKLPEASPHGEELREAVARALAKHDRIEICSDASYALSSYGPKADAALSLMQPEIDRRFAEEKAKLLKRLREPSEDALRAGCNKIDWERSRQEHMPTAPNGIVNLNSTFLTPGATTIGQDMLDAWQAMLAQFEKENSHD